MSHVTTYTAQVESRPLNLQEKEILDALLENNFPGRDEIKQQLSNALVKNSNCSCGCLTISFSVLSSIIIPVKERIPVEASYSKNNEYYEILLHVWEGVVLELEFVTYGNKVDLEYPRANELKIKINEK